MAVPLTTMQRDDDVRSSDRGPARSVLELASPPHADATEAPVLICLLGNFALLKGNEPVAFREGGKAELLLSTLALQPRQPFSRDRLLAVLWPGAATSLAKESLNSLNYSLNKLLGDALNGQALIVHGMGGYRLNLQAGVGVDVVEFERLVAKAKELTQAGCPDEAAVLHGRAIQLYRGDLTVGSDPHAIIERERLRALYLSLLGQRALCLLERSAYVAALEHAQLMLASDPCREDAHRLVMRCYVRLGERAQALRQYQLCKQILRAEFDVAPEEATTALYDQVRLDPGAL
jgi:DNA-binding SARP family transcriptional activator